ncbi:LOW QUALITY PROTEIN: hypothetical protein V2J09_010834 [Rumex salicifolius]
MTNLSRLEFIALDVSEKNYLSWMLDEELHLTSNNMGQTIMETQAHPYRIAPKQQYFFDRFDHQRIVILPRARFEWMYLRLQDFKNYNSEMCRIVSTLRLCGETVKDEDMLEKTLSTFHASNLYKEHGFMTYSELHTCLILAEENNQILLHNHQNRPAGSVSIPSSA